MSGKIYSGGTGRPNDTRPPGLPHWSWAILASALAWAVIFLAIPPGAQNFPLGDDWAFAHGAIWFAHGQGIHYSKWASMPQLGQWLWSSPFLFVFADWPHFALRLSAIVLSWLGLSAFYNLLRQEKIPQKTAALAAGALALDPLVFVSSGTYMTDVPALSFGLLALNFYSRALGGKNPRWLLAAAVLAVLAVVTRQTMLAVPAAAGFLLLRNREIRWRPIWLLSVCVPVAVCLYTAWWFSKRPDVLPMQPVFSLREILFRPFLAVHWCGLVVLPLCLLVPRPGNWKIFLACLAVMLLAAGGGHFFDKDLPPGGMFPYCPGMLSVWGTYSDGLVAGQREILLTTPWRLALTILGCAGAAQILAALVEMFRAGKFPGALLLFTLLQFFILLTLPYLMDRYLEVLFPGAIFLVATQCSASRSGGRAGMAALVLCGLVSVALFHDWLSWNSARWELGRQAVATNIIQPADIEGGFEWNGWFGCAEPGVAPNVPRADGVGSLTLPFSRDFFPQVRGRFALAFTPPPNSIVVASLPYSLWLPPAKKEFLFVRQPP